MANQSWQQHSLLGGSAVSFSTTGTCIANRRAPGVIRQDGHPLRTRGPQVSPTAVSCTRQVQSSTVVVARSTHIFILRDRATAATDGNLSLSALRLIAAAALHPMKL